MVKQIPSGVLKAAVITKGGNSIITIYPIDQTDEEIKEDLINLGDFDPSSDKLEIKDLSEIESNKHEIKKKPNKQVTVVTVRKFGDIAMYFFDNNITNEEIKNYLDKNKLADEECESVKVASCELITKEDL